MARRRRYDYDDYSDFPVYISAAVKKEKAAISLTKLKKKNPDITPIVIEGTTIARSWWGKSWNKNLEGYADYSNRISRGRCYVRSGAVLDLQVFAGEITGLVQGSRAKPYSVSIKISSIAPAVFGAIKNACAGKLESLNELLTGTFPRELAELFTQQESGLFPSPRDIGFSCTCPDYAYMCKHVAAVLYGVSARLDSQPGLFFTLRGIEVKNLVADAVQSKSQELLGKAKQKSSRVMEDTDLSALFGIELAETPVALPVAPPLKKPAKKRIKPVAADK